MYLFLASLAAATSDTWATEIGRRYGGKPFQLRQISKDEIGRSGAMTFIGTLASLAGSSSLRSQVLRCFRYLRFQL